VHERVRPHAERVERAHRIGVAALLTQLRQPRRVQAIQLRERACVVERERLLGVGAREQHFESSRRVVLGYHSASL
jgi:hypothetical protein